MSHHCPAQFKIFDWRVITTYVRVQYVLIHIYIV
jgi:hypothetical protein